MTDIKELINLMQEIEDQLVVCMRCGMCQSVCPLYAQTGREADVARGKLALLDGLMQEMLDNPERVSEHLNRCLLCGSCASGCPSGVNVMEIFIKARAILTGYTGLPAAKKLILRGMLSRPETFDRLTEWGARFQTLFTRKVNDVIGTSCARFASPLLSDRHFKPLATVPFHRKIPSLNSKAGNRGIKVAYFVGCLIDKVYPNIAQSVIDVLKVHSIGIYMPEGQGCCGIPALSSGDTETFNRLLDHNVRKLEEVEFDYLITACATCTSTIKEIWPLMAGSTNDDLKSSVERLAAITLDINQFIVSKLDLGSNDVSNDEGEIKVTYHDPCHLKKALGVTAEPRALIDATEGVERIEMKTPDACCGMGGSFNLQYYDISSRIGRLKRDDIIATGCSTVTSGCPACMMQISDALSSAGDQVSVRHPIELYAEVLRRNESPT